MFYVPSTLSKYTIVKIVMRIGKENSGTFFMFLKKRKMAVFKKCTIISPRVSSFSCSVFLQRWRDNDVASVKMSLPNSCMVLILYI